MGRGTKGPVGWIDTTKIWMDSRSGPGGSRPSLSEYEDGGIGDSLANLKATTYALGETAASKARGAFSAAADGLETIGSYVRGNNLNAMAADLREIVRKYPFYSVLIGVGLIYFLSRNKH